MDGGKSALSRLCKVLRERKTKTNKYKSSSHPAAAPKHSSRPGFQSQLFSLGTGRVEPPVLKASSETAALQTLDRNLHRIWAVSRPDPSPTRARVCHRLVKRATLWRQLHWRVRRRRGGCAVRDLTPTPPPPFLQRLAGGWSPTRSQWLPSFLFCSIFNISVFVSDLGTERQERREKPIADVYSHLEMQPRTELQISSSPPPPLPWQKKRKKQRMSMKT